MYRRIVAFALTFALSLALASLFQPKTIIPSAKSWQLRGATVAPVYNLPEGCTHIASMKFSSPEFKPQVYCDHSLSPDERLLLEQHMLTVHGPDVRFDVVMPTNMPLEKTHVRLVYVR
jgi:hypothetical protein